MLRDSVTRQREAVHPRVAVLVRDHQQAPAGVVADAIEVPAPTRARPPSRRRACSERSRTCLGPRSSRREAGRVGEPDRRPRTRPAPSCGVTWTISPVSTPSRNRFESPLSSPSCPATTQRPSARTRRWRTSRRARTSARLRSRAAARRRRSRGRCGGSSSTRAARRRATRAASGGCSADRRPAARPPDRAASARSRPRRSRAAAGRPAGAAPRPARRSSSAARARRRRAAAGRAGASPRGREATSSHVPSLDHESG